MGTSTNVTVTALGDDYRLAMEGAANEVVRLFRLGMIALSLWQLQHFEKQRSQIDQMIIVGLAIARLSENEATNFLNLITGEPS